MASISWKSNGSGAWTTAVDWSSNSVPGASDDVTIDVSGVTVTISAGNQAAYTLYTYQSTLALAGGALTIGSYGSFEGNVTQTAGTLLLRGRGGLFDDTFNQTAGTVTVQGGALQLEGTETLKGTVSGTGSLVLSGGSLTLASGVVLSVGKALFEYGTVNLGANLAYAGACSVQNASFALNGHTLTLSGGDVVGGTFSQTGTVALTGSGLLYDLNLDGSVVMTISSTYSVAQTIYVGGASGSTAQLRIGTTGSLRITADASISDSSSGTLVNAGTLVKVGGAGAAVIGASVVNAATGTISVLTGGITLQGTNNILSGHISGPGTIDFDYTNTTLSSGLSLTVAEAVVSGGTVTLGSKLSYANAWGQDGGTLSLANASSVLTLTGTTTLDEGTITGSGTISTTGAVTLGGIDIEGAAHLVIAGTADQTGETYLGEDGGSTAAATISAAGVWQLSGDVTVYGDYGTLVNDGILEKTGGASTGTLYGILDSTGKIELGVGRLDLAGGGSLGGTVSGQGTLILDGTYSLLAGLALSNASVWLDYGQDTLDSNLTYAGAWSQTGGTLQLSGFQFTAGSGASLDNGTVAGNGTMTLAGSSTLGEVNLASGAVMAVSGHAEQTFDISVGEDGSGAALDILKGATYTLDDTASIYGSGTLSVTGSVIASGVGTVTVDPAVFDLGSINVGNTTMVFDNVVSGKGVIAIGATGTAVFQDAVSATTTISFAAGGASTEILDPTTFAGYLAGFASGDSIQLSDFDASTTVFKVSGTNVIIHDSYSDTITLHFATAQTASTLYLGVGADGDVALFHT